MILVTTVTCARNVYGKLASFYIDTGGFTAERLTRASDNGDRRHSTRLPAAGSGCQYRVIINLTFWAV